MKIKVKNSGVVRLTARKDRQRGNLFIAEASRNVPFNIRRVYLINNFGKVALAERGGHAHKKLTQAIFCVNGSFVLGLDDGTKKQKLVLNKADYGVILGPKLWHTMSRFSRDCVIVVFASDYYKESDYIREYDEFLKIVTRSR